MTLGLYRSVCCIADKDPVDPGRVAGAQDRAEIARLLHMLDDNNQSVCVEPKVRQRPLGRFTNSQYAFRRSPYAILVKTISVTSNTGTFTPDKIALQLLLFFVAPEQFRAHIKFLKFDPGSHGAQDLARSVDDRHTGTLRCPAVLKRTSSLTRGLVRLVILSRGMSQDFQGMSVDLERPGAPRTDHFFAHGRPAGGVRFPSRWQDRHG